MGVEAIMLTSALTPPDLAPVSSLIGPDLPSQRAADLEGIVSVAVRDLFADITREIYTTGDDLALIRRATEESLADVDMTRIKADDKVNLLCSEHGFALMGGEPYAEMVKTIKDVVADRTSCKNIRLRFCVGAGLSEARQMIPQYGLHRHFENIVATSFAPQFFLIFECHNHNKGYKNRYQNNNLIKLGDRRCISPWIIILYP